VSALCLCLTARTLDGSMRQLERYRAFIDMAELRLDLIDPVERENAHRFSSRANVPLILTLRLPEDGGEWGKRGESEEERKRLFIHLLESGGWAYIDLEHNRPLDEVVSVARDAETVVIRSVHDFEGTLLSSPVSRISGLLKSLAENDCIPKLAALCMGSRQLLTLARAALALESLENKVVLGMGEFGTPSRILAHRLGSCWTYASPMKNQNEANDEPLAAPGQLNPEILETLYRYRSIDKETPLYAVAGNPVAQSRSPAIHNHWLIESALAGSYLPIRCDDLAALIETCDIWGIQGLSVTLPHKKKAFSLCDYSDPLARRIGAANTMLRGGDGWRARNTDAAGFLSSLPKALRLNDVSELNGMRALVIGGGGAARAAAHALADAGTRLVILNRTESKARILAKETGGIGGPLSADSYPLIRDGVHLAVQTTSLGMRPYEGVDPIPWWKFDGCSLVYDMVYEPIETALLARARAAGIHTMNGLEMLRAQAALQFELFTGMKAPTVD